MARRLVVLRADGVAQHARHVRLEADPVLAALEADEAPQPERERVVVARERHPGQPVAGQPRRLARLPGEEERHRQAPLGHAAGHRVEVGFGEDAGEGVDRGRVAVDDRDERQAQRVEAALPARIGRPRLRAAQEVARLLRAIEPPEEDLDALLQVFGRPIVVDDAVLGGGEHGLGIREALAHGVRPGQQQDGVEADALRDGQLGELSAEVGIAGEEGAAGGVDEQRGRDLGARVEQPPRHAHRVVDGQRVPRPDLLGEPEAQRPAAQLAQPLADDLAVERMRETDLGAGRWRLDHDHAALLRGDERVGRAQRDDLARRAGAHRARAPPAAPAPPASCRPCARRRAP